MRALLIALLLAATVPLSGDGVAWADQEETASAPTDSLMMDVGEVLDDFRTPEPYLYQSAGTRDPFASLIQGWNAGVLREGLPGIEELIVVGILWAEHDRFALVETERGQNLVLRQGDQIRNGEVVEVLPDGVIVRFSHYGVVSTVVLPVVTGLEEKHER
jgi:hypothetical protein